MVTRPLSALLRLATMGCPALRAPGELAACACAPVLIGLYTCATTEPEWTAAEVEWDALEAELEHGAAALTSQT